MSQHRSRLCDWKDVNPNMTKPGMMMISLAGGYKNSAVNKPHAAFVSMI